MDNHKGTKGTKKDEPRFVQMELESGIMANVTYQAHFEKPFWAFAYEDWDYDEDTGEFLQPANGGVEYVQVCMCYGQDPRDTLFKGIHRYDLPLPRNETDRADFLEWESLKKDGRLR